ncbi:hypothetical protein LJB90_02290 [Eubacteriales bacterium OttesenSCG-928-G02]|nr:hypothetical protein [Eubacteriales bacterium OttesenSCG-928-G02]
MEKEEKQAVENTEEPKITYIEYNGRTFEVIQHFSGEQTFSDIVKNAIRREFEK